MSEDEFRDQVLGHLAALGHRFDAVDRRLDAIVARLDEQDDATDRLTAKVDRLSQTTAAALAAGEQAITGLTTLSRHVTRLEGRGE